jgi:hypothetical protein
VRWPCGLDLRRSDGVPADETDPGSSTQKETIRTLATARLPANDQGSRLSTNLWPDPPLQPPTLSAGKVVRLGFGLGLDIYADAGARVRGTRPLNGTIVRQMCWG